MPGRQKPQMSVADEMELARGSICHMRNSKQRPGAVKSLANGELKDGQRPSQVSKEGVWGGRDEEWRAGNWTGKPRPDCAGSYS